MVMPFTTVKVRLGKTVFTESALWAELVKMVAMDSSVFSSFVLFPDEI
jgi:hypothetical protein